MTKEDLHMYNRSGLIIRVLAGGYLAYLGGGLFKDALLDRPENYIIYMVVGALFAVLGAYWCVRAVIRIYKKDYNDVKRYDDSETALDEEPADEEDERK